MSLIQIECRFRSIETRYNNLLVEYGIWIKNYYGTLFMLSQSAKDCDTLRLYNPLKLDRLLQIPYGYM